MLLDDFNQKFKTLWGFDKFIDYTDKKANEGNFFFIILFALIFALLLVLFPFLCAIWLICVIIGVLTGKLN